MRTKVLFLDPKQVFVETPKDDKYILAFLTEMNYKFEEEGCHFLDMVAKFFDEYFNSSDKHLYNELNRFLIQYRFESLFSFRRDHIQHRVIMGERIRTLREQKSLDVESLAQRANIQPNTLKRIEAGRLSVDLDVLAQIAQGLGMKLDFVELEIDNENENRKC